ncbi:hypothetical protein IAR50_004887 [Cryptococcus sp. DSM 104548]
MRTARLARQLPPLASRTRPAPTHPSPLPLPAPLPRTCIRPYATPSSPQPTVEQQLVRFTKLLQSVASVNSRAEKRAIIVQYPDLRDVLELIYTPDFRTHITSARYHKHLSTAPSPLSPSTTVPVPDDIPALFHILSTRTVTGNDAGDLVVAFLEAHGVRGKEELEEMFGRLLDRHLVGGFGARMLKDANWDASEKEESGGAAPKPKLGRPKGKSTSTPTTTTITPILPNFEHLEKFEVALGKSIEPPFDSLFTGQSAGGVWYASRKLDGLRVLTFLDFAVPPEGTEGEPKLLETHFVSRTAKPFKSLSLLGDQLASLAAHPRLSELLAYDLEAIPHPSGTGTVKRLVLDGEVCVMRRRTEEELRIGAGTKRDDGSLADGMWDAQDPWTENFPSTVSQVRKSDDIEHLSYFLFDVLPWCEVHEKGALPGLGLSQTFSQRAQVLQDLTMWLNTHLEQQGVGKEGRMVKELRQVKVEKAGDVEEMVSRAAEEGWEGLVLRKDVLYKGVRSTDIRKFKKWQDAEYTVLSTTNSIMRLAINGQFAERPAMANVWINHKGTKVAVGSGWTAEQRLRYAERPEDIVGKEITVEYFEESERIAGNEGRGKSLRFPRVKKVWEEGKRDV